MGAGTQRVWSLSVKEKRRAEQRVAVTVAVLFVLAGIAWVFATDAALYRFARDPVLIARIETAKGWLFVGLGGALIYGVTLRSAVRLTRAHATISAVVESIGDGVLLLGRDRTIKHANPSALRMLGCERLRDLVGIDAAEFSRRFRMAYPDGSLVPPERFVSQRVFVEGGPLQHKSVLHPPDAPELVISTTAAAVRDEVGEPADVVVSVMHDITTSEHLERLRDQFFAAAAHTLKTPVAIIKANAQIMSRDPEPRCRRSIAAIERQCGRIDRLVQNLLVLARARSRTLELHLEEVDLARIVERVARETRAASPHHEVRSEIVASPRIHADPERLALALRNVLDEASRSSPSGSRVTVLLRQEGANAEVAVRHRPLSPEERTCEAYADYDDLGIARCASTTIFDAHGGSSWREAADAEATSWIRLPAAAGENA
jgi:signal transduction histidine kinase